MKKNHKNTVSFLLSGFFFINILILLSCTSIKWRYDKINIIIPEKISITEDEIRQVFQSSREVSGTGAILDVTIYSFTTGYESIKFNSDNSFSQDNHNGSLKLLLKLKKNNVIEDIRFVSIDGKDKADILKRLDALIREMAR